MSEGYYNGYDWKTRMAIVRAVNRGEAGANHHKEGVPCGLCGDPNRPPTEWHSEDYSLPYSFVPPQTYPLCSACHGRLHKRFNRPPEEWELFCRHIEAGGYARDFTRLYPPRKRSEVMDAIAGGAPVNIAPIRDATVSDKWWRDLTLDPESLTAAWARPRPHRPRPDSEAFRVAAAEIGLSDRQADLLKAHASAPRRSASMRYLANEVMGKDSPGAMNLFYGRLARKFCEHLNWQPDRRKDGSPIWMTIVAEGWYPKGREFEWVMVPSLAEAI